MEPHRSRELVICHQTPRFDNVPTPPKVHSIAVPHGPSAENRARRVRRGYRVDICAREQEAPSRASFSKADNAASRDPRMRFVHRWSVSTMHASSNPPATDLLPIFLTASQNQRREQARSAQRFIQSIGPRSERSDRKPQACDCSKITEHRDKRGLRWKNQASLQTILPIFVAPGLNDKSSSNIFQRSSTNELTETNFDATFGPVIQSERDQHFCPSVVG